MAELALKDGGMLYYEVHGEGAPVLFLNGIMMNAMSWAEHVPVLSKKLRVILVDFRDQGRSSKRAGQYTLDDHADDVAELLDGLGLGRVHLMGLSYGGQVALRLALAHADRLATLTLANVVRRIGPHLQAIGTAWERAAELGDGGRFFDLALPFIYSSYFYESSFEYLASRRELFETMLTREWFDALLRLNRSVEGYEVTTEELASIDAPTLLVGADDDFIAPLRGLEELYDTMPNAELLVLPKAGHAAFLERKDELMTAIIGFVTKHS